VIALHSEPTRNAALVQFATENPVLSLLMFLPIRWGGDGSEELTTCFADLGALMGDVPLCTCIGAVLIELQGFRFYSSDRSAAA
jgi:hypothetical protein